MEIILKNVKYAKFASDETACFEATVYVNGVKMGEASNQGCGGETMIHPESLRKMLADYCQTLPDVISGFLANEDGTPFTFKPTPDYLIDQAFSDQQAAADLRKLLSKRVLIDRGDGIAQTKVLKADILARLLSDEMIAQKMGTIKSKILNFMPFEDALRIFVERTA